MDAADQDDQNGGSTLFSHANAWKTGRADRFGWLVDGEHYFAALRDSLEHAEHEILIVGWDIDSKVELIRDPDHDFYPSPLAETLESLVERKPSLKVCVLSWDFALIYMLERELLPAYRFGWQESEQLHFQLDSAHALGASHHQKFVVIDGVVGYVGGFDLTKCRWDTRDHAGSDERRVDTGGEAYRPFHDVQAVVSGAPAEWLRELAADRWRRATGNPLPATSDHGQSSADSVWPTGVPVHGEDVSCCLARTWKDPDNGDDVREVEQLYVDMIAAARRTIYVENQYFTAPAITDALAARLGEDDGPEIVLVVPGETSGWLEQATMEMRRTQLLDQLISQDKHKRLRVVAPVSDDLDDEVINVHAKVMVVDDRWIRIGSANMSCRSLGLDSECDLVVEDDEGSLASSFRADLLAEHLGCTIDEVREATAEHGLIYALNNCGGRHRRLERVRVAPEDYSELLEPLARIADMEQPIESLWEDAGAPSDAGADDSRNAHAILEWIGNKSGWLFLTVVVLAIVGWAIWSATHTDGDFDVWTLLESLRNSAEHPLAPLLAIPAIVAGSLVFAPVTGMVALCALLFSPWIASSAAIVGTLAATIVNYLIGTRLGRAVESHAPEPLASRMRSLGNNADAWSLAGLRLIPIAPFTLVNLMAGAFQVRLRDFIIGTLIGMGPGIVVICLSVDRARAALSGEPVFDPWIVGVIAVAGIAIIAFRVWQHRKNA